MVTYDYADRAHEISLNRFPDTIHIQVISGDEVVTIDGVTYDSSETRDTDFLDDEYDVNGSYEIEQWMSFRPDLRDPLAVSYQRAREFTGRW